jgi:transcriptional regulator with XRE-family HTH domain
MNKSVFARKLREAREKNGFTLEQVAEAIGVTPEQVTAWESGEQLPSALLLDLLTTLYAVEGDSLFDDGPLRYNDPLEPLLPHANPNGVYPPAALLEIREWLNFVNDYAKLVSSEGVQPVPVLLEEREDNAISPELVNRLMSFPYIVVYKGILPPEVKVTSLVFYHPQVGYCFFINARYLQQNPSGLDRYSDVVLRLVRRAVEKGRLSVSAAASLLRVDTTTIERELLAS